MYPEAMGASTRRQLAKKDDLNTEEKVSFDKISSDIESLTLDVNRAQRAADIDAEIRTSQRPPRAAINDPSVSNDPKEVHAEEVRAFESWMKLVRLVEVFWFRWAWTACTLQPRISANFWELFE